MGDFLCCAKVLVLSSSKHIKELCTKKDFIRKKKLVIAQRYVIPNKGNAK
jgi:hypothetical protein